MEKNIPKMIVGKYAGTPVRQLPSSYLRWMLTQDFPADIMNAAKEKLEESDDYNDLFLNVSRHALDMFSKRFLHKWMMSEGHKGEDAVGLATFIATLAQEAWNKGKDISKHRHQNDGVIREWEGIRWVYGINPNYPDYKEIITVMDDID